MGTYIPNPNLLKTAIAVRLENRGISDTLIAVEKEVAGSESSNAINRDRSPHAHLIYYIISYSATFYLAMSLNMNSFTSSYLRQLGDRQMEMGSELKKFNDLIDWRGIYEH